MAMHEITPHESVPHLGLRMCLFCLQFQKVLNNRHRRPPAPGRFHLVVLSILAFGSFRRLGG
jgi:hypothetical protein